MKSWNDTITAEGLEKVRHRPKMSTVAACFLSRSVSWNKGSPSCFASCLAGGHQRRGRVHDGGEGRRRAEPDEEGSGHHQRGLLKVLQGACHGDCRCG